MVVDTETHIFYFARPSYTNPISRVKHYTWHEHPVELLIAEMDQAGVDKTFLISYDAEDVAWGGEPDGYRLEDFAGGAKYTLTGVRKYPDRFWWFNTVKSPARRDAQALVKQDFANGAAGIKLFPAYIQSHLTDPGLWAVFDETAAVGGRVLISFEKLRPPDSLSLEVYLQELSEVLQGYPKTKFALLHNGCVDPLSPRIEAVLELVRTHSNLYLSTAYPGEVWDDHTEYPYANYQKRIQTLIEGVGADRVMWATDWPWFEDKFKYQQGVDCIRRHADYMSEEEKAMFLGGTAEAFMGIGDG